MPALLGFVVIILLIVLIMKDKTCAPVVFCTLPVIASLILGFNFNEIVGWFSGGFGSTINNIAISVFGVTFFQIMDDLGVFDGMTGYITKKLGHNIMPAFIACWIITYISSLDASSISTVLVTAPAIMPLFKRMKVRPMLIAVIIAMVEGPTQFMPYSNPANGIAVSLGINVEDLWSTALPIYACGIVLSLVITILMAIWEKKRIAAGKNDYLSVEHNIQAETVEYSEWHKKTRIFNIILTVVVMVLLLASLVQASVAFAIGLAITLLVNYPTTRQQIDAIKKFAGMPLFLGMTFLCAGAYSSIMTESGMMDGMLNALLALFPESIAAHLHVVIGVLSMPLGFVLGPDAYYYGLTPVAGGVVQAYGVSAMSAGIAINMGKFVGMLCGPTTPNLYMLTDMCETTPREYFKAAFVILWIMTLIMLAFGLVAGIIQF